MELKSTGRCQALKGGLARAAQFIWERTARETIAVYERVLAAAEPAEQPLRRQMLDVTEPPAN